MFVLSPRKASKTMGQLFGPVLQIGPSFSWPLNGVDRLILLQMVFAPFREQHDAASENRPNDFWFSGLPSKEKAFGFAGARTGIHVLYILYWCMVYHIWDYVCIYHIYIYILIVTPTCKIRTCPVPVGFIYNNTGSVPCIFLLTYAMNWPEGAWKIDCSDIW